MRTFYPETRIKLSKYLLDVYEGGLSYSVFCKLLRKKDIRINGEKTGEDVYLCGGEKVDVYFDGEKTVGSYTTIFEDENILIVDKNKGVSSETLFEKLKFERGNIYFCHRLDTNTDGVIVFAKNQTSYNEIVDGFKRRTFDKIYLAEVYGIFEKKSDVLTAYMEKDSENAIVRVLKNKTKDSKKIVTEYKVIEEKNGNSKLLVKLLTGRTHQIRAHLAFVGHFILGDGKYGSEKINRALKVKQMALSSVSITFHFEKSGFLAYLDGKTFTKKGYENLSEIP